MARKPPSRQPVRAYPRFLDERRGLCATEDPELFSDTTGRGRARLDRMDKAKAICAECPFKAPCLAFALETFQEGVWGGTNDEERTWMRRKADRRVQVA